MRMVQDDQSADGGVPNVVPGKGDGAANWQTAYPTILWSLLTYEGDLEVIRSHYASLQKYFGYFDMQYKKTGIANFFGGFGDWCPAGPKGDSHLVSAYSYLADLEKMIDMATAVGKQDDAKSYAATRQKLLTEYHTAFYNNATGAYKSGLQSEQSLPLWLGAGDTASQQSVLANLRKD